LESSYAFFLKSVDCWKIVETGWTKLDDTNLKLVSEEKKNKKKKRARLANDKTLHALCQALSPSKFARISNCETTRETWQILETTYEGKKTC
jgi:hypothetical protein